MRIGQYFEDSGTRLRLDSLTDGIGILRNVETNETRTAPENKLVDAVLSGALALEGHTAVERAQVESLNGTQLARVNARQESPTAVHDMLAKRAWIQALKIKGIDRIVDEPWVRTALDSLARGELKDQRRYSIGSLAKAARLLSKADGDWSQLVPRFSQRGGLGKPRIDHRAEAAIDRILDTVQKDRNRRIVKEELSAEVRDEVNSVNLGCPHDPISVPGYSTISRRISERFTALEICRRNRGDNLKGKLFRENSYPRDVAEFPLLVSEYDDLNAKTFLIDDDNFLPFGRAYLTHGVCQATGVPLGYDVSHEPRSFDSAIGAILSSFLPKDLLHPDFEGCKHPWIGYGNQGTILVDNASYNFSKSMGLQTQIMTLPLAGASPGCPTEKCGIEHFNAVTEQDFCQFQPGWCGDEEDADGSKTGMATAVLTVASFRKNYVQWVTGVYLNKAGIDGWTPKQRWFRHFKEHAPAVRWSRTDIALLRLRPRLLRFRASGGIKRLNLTYNSDELIRLRQQLGHISQVLVHVDRNDLTYINVTDPTSKALIQVPCTTNWKYVSGLSEQQQVLILKMARRRGQKNPNLHNMVEARQELRDLVIKQSTSVKMAKRRFAKRVGPVQDISVVESSDTNDAQHSETRTKVVSQLMTDLEWDVHQLEEIELNLDEDSWETQ